MDAAGDPYRDQRKARRLGKARQGQRATHTPRRTNNDTNEREGAHGVAHIFFVPFELRHRDGRKHGKGHRNGLQNDHFSTPL